MIALPESVSAALAIAAERVTAMLRAVLVSVARVIFTMIGARTVIALAVSVSAAREIAAA